MKYLKSMTCQTPIDTSTFITSPGPIKRLHASRIAMYAVATSVSASPIPLPSAAANAHASINSTPPKVLTK